MIFQRTMNRVGERLSQYCFARVLADCWHSARESHSIPAFQGMNCMSKGERKLAAATEWCGQSPWDRRTGRRIEAGELSIPGEGVLILSGSFQRFDLVSKRREDIRNSWLRLDKPSASRHSGNFLICAGCDSHMGDRGQAKVNEDDCAPSTQQAALRRGARLTEPEIRSLVKTVPHTRLHFLVDDVNDPMLVKLRDLRGTVHCGGGMEDFRLIQSFQKVAICQSSFQWWAAFLGHAKEIYFPPIDRGIWSHPEPADLITDPWWWGIDLRVPDDARYIYDWWK